MASLKVAPLVLTLALLPTQIAFALDCQQLEEALDEVLDTDATARRTTVALKVVDLQSGKVLYDRFGDRLFTPASNLKIYTAACALDIFDPQQTFPTSIVAQIDESTREIIGNLRLVGGGNAMLSTADLELLAERVVSEWQVTAIRGKVEVDNSRYSDVQLGPGWMWDDQPYYYNMRVTPLMLDFNVEPIPGKFDDDGDPVRRTFSDPQQAIAEKYTKLLKSLGVAFESPRRAETKTRQRTIRYAGTPLAPALKHFNHVSENAVGEVLLHEIAIAKGHRQPTWSHGAKCITDWLHDTAGLQPESFRLVDGSGLSRYNLISADSSVKLLQFMRRHRHYQTFYASLPAYAVEIRPDENRMLVRAKPGGMSGVSTISGYLTTLEGRQLAFSLLANGFIGSSKPVQDLRTEIWKVLARYSK